MSYIRMLVATAGTENKYPNHNIMKNWYDNKALLIVLLFVFFPIGCYGIWKRKETNKSKKWIYTIAGTPYFLLILIIVLGSILPEPDYYSIGMKHYETKEYDKAISNLRRVNEENPNYNEASSLIEELILLQKIETAHGLYGQAEQLGQTGNLSEASLLIDSCLNYYDKLISEYPPVKDSDPTYSQAIELKTSISQAILEEERNKEQRLLSQIMDFFRKIDEKTSRIDQAGTQATQFLSDFAKRRANANQTIEALDIGINVCNNENMLSIDVSSEFDESLTNQCEEILSAYSTAYSSRLLSFDYGKRAIEKNQPEILDDALRNGQRYQQELLTAVVLDMQLRNQYGIKMRK